MDKENKLKIIWKKIKLFFKHLFLHNKNKCKICKEEKGETMSKLDYTRTHKKIIDTINSFGEEVDKVTYVDGKAKIEYKNGGTINLPIKAGTGVVIDADETGTGLEIHTDGGGTVYRHTLTVNGYGTDFYAVLYLSRSEKIENLAILKSVLGDTFILPISGAISSGALGAGYYIATYLDENALNVSNTTDVKTINYDVITITDTVTAV